MIQFVKTIPKRFHFNHLTVTTSLVFGFNFLENNRKIKKQRMNHTIYCVLLKINL